MLKQIFKHRERARFLSAKWFRLLLKRAFSLPDFFKLILYVRYLRFRGAVVNEFSVVERFRYTGHLRNLMIGSQTFISGRSSLRLIGKISIGSNVVINEGVYVFTASHSLKSPHWELYSRDIVIEDYAWLSTNCLILPGVRIGYGAVIGAGAVVREDVPAFSIVGGNPAVKIGERVNCEFDYSPIRGVACVEAWLGKNFSSFKIL